MNVQVSLSLPASLVSSRRRFRCGCAFDGLSSKIVARSITHDVARLLLKIEVVVSRQRDALGSSISMKGHLKNVFQVLKLVAASWSHANTFFSAMIRL